jgi:lipopolysaccharide transport system permease protein
MKTSQIKIYTPHQKNGFYVLLMQSLNGLWEGRELAMRLFIRDLKSSYTKSFFGIFWVFLPPIVTAGIWILLNYSNVVVFNNSPMDYAAYTIVGTTLWAVFAESISKPLQRYQAAMGMMIKLNFPREAIILASLYDLIFSFILKLIIIIPILTLLGYPPSLNFIPSFLAIFGLMLLGLSIGLFLCPIGLLYGDIAKALPILLPLGMFVTPVLYPLSEGRFLNSIQSFNPVTPFLERSRSLIGTYAFHMESELLIWSIVMLLLLPVALIILRISLPIIVERSGS